MRNEILSVKDVLGITVPTEDNFPLLDRLEGFQHIQVLEFMVNQPP